MMRARPMAAERWVLPVPGADEQEVGAIVEPAIALADRGRSAPGEVPVQAPCRGQQVGKACGERRLAAAIVGQGQQPDHAPAGGALIEGLEQRVEGAAAGVAREQLIAVDEVQQCHRLCGAEHG